MPAKVPDADEMMLGADELMLGEPCNIASCGGNDGGRGGRELGPGLSKSKIPPVALEFMAPALSPLYRYIYIYIPHFCLVTSDTFCSK
jgi:hypothetical protein